jgi:Spy/CpxP family protein refolding chaperone
MTTRRKTILRALAMTAALGVGGAVFVSAVDAQAFRGQRGRQMPAGQMMKEPMRGPMLGSEFARLNLTDTQREQVRAIASEHREQLATSARRVRDARLALAQAVRTGADEESIRSHGRALGEAEAEVAMLRARVHAQVVDQVLTAEQRQLLEERRAAMQKRMEERRKSVR